VASSDGSIIVRRLDIGASLVPDQPMTWDVITAEGGVKGRFTTTSDTEIRYFEWPHIYAYVGDGHEREIMRFRLGEE
jgi:hypothetical protein